MRVETLAAYVTLCQGLERDALIEAVGIVQKHLHRSGDAGPIADLLRDQNPAPRRHRRGDPPRTSSAKLPCCSPSSGTTSAPTSP